MIRIIHGSPDSTDLDVLYFVVEEASGDDVVDVDNRQAALDFCRQSKVA